jgi:uncharacterized protein
MSQAERKRVNQATVLAIRYIESLRKSGYPVSRAYLYGSFAKGKPRKGSDIDVCVVSRAYDSNDDRKRLFLWEKRRDIDVRIEPVGFTPKDFIDKNPLVFEIKKTGIDLTKVK